MLLKVYVEQDWQTLLLQSKTGAKLQQLQPVHAASPSADVDGVSPITAFALLLIASVSCTATEASSCTEQYVIVNNIGSLYVFSFLAHSDTLVLGNAVLVPFARGRQQRT